jgi:tetratricopeptide (TPR) repeat protein
MDTEQQVAGLIKKAYDKLKASEPESAAALLDEALHIDFDNEETKYALKSVNWWLEQLDKVKDIKNLYEKGGMILSLYKRYWVFLDSIAGDYDRCQYAIRRYVCSYALECFKDLLGGGENQHDPDLLLLVGRCYKGTGNFDEALKYFQQAARFKREDGETLAELADVNAQLGEVDDAKALFREAFFLNPEKIELRAMESEMIVRLRAMLLSEKKFREEELREWIPVYGRLLGVFSVIREMKPIEFGRLKQSIFTLETECRGNPAQCAILKPRLLNRYFWLLDYYTSNNEDPALIEGILLKIKTTDSEIYERYMR